MEAFVAGIIVSVQGMATNIRRKSINKVGNTWLSVALDIVMCYSTLFLYIGMGKNAYGCFYGLWNIVFNDYFLWYILLFFCSSGRCVAVWKYKK